MKGGDGMKCQCQKSGKLDVHIVKRLFAIGRVQQNGT